DFRARPHSDEEAEFLASTVAGSGLGVTYRDLEKASNVLLVGLEPEEEAAIVFLRLRKAAKRSGTRIWSIAPYTTLGLRKMDGTLLRAAPGTEAEVLEALSVGGPESGLDGNGRMCSLGLREEGSI